MPWQPADPGTIAQDAQGMYHVKVGGQWTPAPKGSVAKDAQGAYHFNNDSLAPPAPAPDPIGEANKAADAAEHSPVQDALDFFTSGIKAVGPQLKNLITNGINPDAVIDHIGHIARSVIENPSATLSSVGSALRNATPQQAGPAVIPGVLAGEGIGLAARGATAIAAPAAAESAASTLGLRTAEGAGATMAGETAGPTLNAQNQRVASSVLGADAGVPHSSPVNADTLKAARKAPGNVLDAGYQQVPTGPLSQAAREQVLAARGPQTITKPTPNVANSINDIESSLVDPNGQFTGAQLRATRNSLSSDADAGLTSEDADTRAIAAYKRGVVNALDQHVQDTMLPNSTVTPDMITNARATLGKNYQLQDLIGKGGDIDLQKLAKLHRDSPDLLTGNTRTVAQFASDHPEVTGSISNADRIEPPSLMTDLAHVNILNPRTWVQPLVGAAGRRLLRGPSGEAIGNAMQAPVAGLGGEFDIRPPSELDLAPPAGQVGNAPIQRTLPLQPGPGRPVNPTGGLTASPPSTPPAAAASHAGDIPLADLLSHGVEQGPAPGLSLAPEGAPAPEGIPFRPNLEHAAGGLQLSPEDWLNNFLRGENNSDLAGVKSQGVPENIMTRAANNASGESAASQEAINRGSRPLSIIDQDGNETPLLRDVTQADRRAPKGKLIIDTSTGEIIDRGGLSQARANGLRNRWATNGRTLGDHFVMGAAGG